MVRKFTHADFEPEGERYRDSQGRFVQPGTVTVYYNNGTNQSFKNITDRAFFHWHDTGFDKNQTPKRVVVLPPIPTEEDYPEPEEDEEDEEPNIHPNDYIGQVTGVQSWNFQMDEDGNLLPPLEYESSKLEASEEPSKERLSTYHGVFWLDDSWLAALKDADEWVLLGRFGSEIECADHYDCAAYRYLGKDAKLNFPGNQTVFVAQGQ